MRCITALFLLILCLPAAAIGAGSTLDASTTPKQGEMLTNFGLPTPQDPQQAAYLGLDPQQQNFSLNEIGAEALLVEIFSMYCPFCQREAPEVNEMFAKLRSSNMDGRLKMLGIGTGNSEYEVNVFREKFTVQMPLFADPDFTVYNTIGQVGTPFFMLLQPQPETDGLKILYVHEGIINDPEAFYTNIIDRAQNLPQSP